MSAGKEVVHAIANDKVYGDKIAKAIDEISEATNAALLKELEATRAELAAEREKCMLIAQDLKWENQLSLKLQESKAELEATRAELAEWKESANSNKITGELWPSPAAPVLLKARLEHLASWISGLSKRIDTDKAELEATRAELAAERAKSKGGVAWALISSQHGGLYMENSGSIAIFVSRDSAEARRSELVFPDDWAPTVYTWGDGADELKAAIEAKEKAEAEVAAWKEAARHRYQDTILIESPNDLIRRIDNLKTDVEQRNKWVSELKAELAALKAAPAEVPPLDKWRVLATANKIMLREYNNSSHGSANESLCNSVRWALSSILIAERKDREQVYPFKD